MNFLSLFSGIGGFDYGLMSAGHTCVGYVEMDKYAHQSFQILHDPDKKLWNAYDIRSVTDDEIRQLKETLSIQVLLFGFPCQSFSIAGNRKGFEDKTRGTLFFEACRFAKIIMPEMLLIENVEGLLSHDNGETFRVILETLNEIGYEVDCELLNTADFGVPQNRVRIFIAGVRI